MTCFHQVIASTRSVWRRRRRKRSGRSSKPGAETLDSRTRVVVFFLPEESGEMCNFIASSRMEFSLVFCSV